MGFSNLQDLLNASDGSEAAVKPKTRIGWLEFIESV